MDRRVIFARESLLAVSKEYVSLGWDVFFPLTEDSPVDLVILRENTFLRVQIKSVRLQKNAMKIKVRSTNNWSNKKYTRKDVDILAVHERKSDTCYVIPIHEIEGMSQVTLRTTKLKGIECRQADDYLIQE